MLIGRWLMATIGIFSGVWATERGRCIGIVPMSHHAGLQMYGWIINMTCILM